MIFMSGGDQIPVMMVCKGQNTSPFRKGQNTSPFRKGQNISPFRKTPNISPPLAKGAGGIFTVGEGYKPCFHTFFTRKCTSNILISLHAFSSCFVTGLRHVGFMGNPP
jgi:hypothetical protein